MIDKLNKKTKKKNHKIDENIENWRNNSKIKLKTDISIISGRILREKWNFRNFRGGMEDDSRVSIVNDVNNCSSSTKSSRRDAPLPLFRATDISRNGSVICSMSKLFIVSFHHPYGSNKNRKFNFEPRDSDRSVHEWLAEEKRETLLTILRSLNRWIINLDAFCSERGSGSLSHFYFVT